MTAKITQTTIVLVDTGKNLSEYYTSAIRNLLTQLESFPESTEIFVDYIEQIKGEYRDLREELDYYCGFFNTGSIKYALDLAIDTYSGILISLNTIGWDYKDALDEIVCYSMFLLNNLLSELDGTDI